jgi:hypothetical protein
MQILFSIFPLFFSLFIIYVNNSTGKREKIGKLLPHYYKERGKGNLEMGKEKAPIFLVLRLFEKGTYIKSWKF